jgi:hypothetical protein
MSLNGRHLILGVGNRGRRLNHFDRGRDVLAIQHQWTMVIGV